LALTMSGHSARASASPPRDAAEVGAHVVQPRLQQQLALVDDADPLGDALHLREMVRRETSVRPSLAKSSTITRSS